jgi:U3 small nucleolar RNA-associated protein 4
MAKQKKRKRPQADSSTPQQAAKQLRLDAAAAGAAAAPEADSREAAAQPQPQQQQLAPQQPPAAEPAELVALHRARFVPWQPAAVVACAFTPDGSVLAVGQESGGIELWETATWTCFQV